MNRSQFFKCLIGHFLDFRNFQQEIGYYFNYFICCCVSFGWLLVAGLDANFQLQLEICSQYDCR